MNRASNAYLQTKVTTTNQGDLVVLLYDGALKFLAQAKAHLAANDMAKKGIAISKALDIITELDNALNMEKGGEISKNLRGLYFFCTNHLMKANIKKDAKMVDEVMKILMGLRGAYAEILSNPEAQAAAQEAADNLKVVSHTATRHQSGFASTGSAAVAPGAGNRVRNMMYARHNLDRTAAPAPEAPIAPAAQTAEQVTAAQATAAPTAAVQENTAPQAAANAPAAPASPQAAPAPAATAPPQAATPPAAQAEAQAEQPIQGFGQNAYPPMGGMAAMRAKADLYKRFSG